MNDRWETTTPANTAETAAVRVKCPITLGYLTTLIINYPAGCHGLARCRVSLGEKPIAPRSGKAYLAADNFTIVLNEVNEKIAGNIPTLNWDVWNVDETYAHTLWLLAEWISAEDDPQLLLRRELVNLRDVLGGWFASATPPSESEAEA